MEYISKKSCRIWTVCTQGRTQGGGEGSLAPPPQIDFGGGRRPPPKIFQVFSPLKTWFSFSMSILYVPIY